MSAVVAYNVAIALAYSRDKKGALGRVEKLRAIDPSAQYADPAMSYILYRDGDLDGALRYQRLAQEKKPGDMWGLARLGMLCGMTGRKEEARGGRSTESPPCPMESSSSTIRLPWSMRAWARTKKCSGSWRRHSAARPSSIGY